MYIDYLKTLAPRIVLLFYHKTANSVNDRHDVTLEVLDVAVHDSFVFNKGRPGLRIVEEVQFFRALFAVLIHCSLGQMGNELAVESVIVDRSDAVFYNLLLGAQTIVVIFEINLSGRGGGKRILCGKRAGETGVDGEHAIGQPVVRSIARAVGNLHLQQTFYQTERTVRTLSCIVTNSQYIHY